MLQATIDRSNIPLRVLAIAAVSGAVVTWGFSAAVIKFISASGVVASVYRLWFAMPFLWMTALSSPSVRKGITPRWITASVVGGTLFAGHQVFFFNALKQTSVTNVSIIGALQPALVLIVAGPWFGERITVRALLWSVVAVLGAGLVVIGSQGTPSWSLHGDILAVVNLFAFTAYFLASKHFRADVGATPCVLGMTTVAGLLMLGAAIVTGEDLFSPRGTDWAWMLFLALVPGTIGHVLSNWAHPHLPAFVISVMLLAVPVISAASAAIFLNEPIRLIQVVGGAVVLGAIGTLVMTSAKPSSDELAESAAETDAP